MKCFLRVYLFIVWIVIYGVIRVFKKWGLVGIILVSGILFFEKESEIYIIWKVFFLNFGYYVNSFVLLIYNKLNYYRLNNNNKIGVIIYGLKVLILWV